MSAKISNIHPGGIAEELELEVGDVILTINGNEIKDIIDYRFLMAEEYIELEVQKKDGEIWTYEVEKEYDDNLGVDFQQSIMDEAKSCSNKCIFCFIDQLPPGMRETLYFKDDDSRLAFLQGNFVTLTNMKDSDIERIIKYRISPINVSVHTTNPELRRKMLNNRFAGNIYERLEKLAAAGITMNSQIVCVPGVNNGEELISTIEDLYKLYPAIQNIAAVPVGSTKYRKGLYNITLYNADNARDEIHNVRKLQEKYIKEIGAPFVRLSDEFYVLAGEKIPDSEFYEGFEQLEDGVGMIRFLRETIEQTLPDLREEAVGEFTLVTGLLAFEEISNIAKLIMDKNNKIKLDVKRIFNRHFGETITVAGLLTGGDILEQLKGNIGPGKIIIPVNMLRSGENVFLDDLTIKDLEVALEREIIKCEYTGEDLIEIINNNGQVRKDIKITGGAEIDNFNMQKEHKE
jgi:putative radical SAM enzyme (TIGR03279 family)